MSTEFVKTPNAPQPKGPYSQGVKAGGFLFIAGQGPFDPQTGKMVAKDIESQTRRTLENIKAIVEASSMTLRDIVKVTVCLRNIDDFQRMNEVYKTFFPENPPVRTTIEGRLPAADMLILIDAIAHHVTA